jgi:hypothetical protein
MGNDGLEHPSIKMNNMKKWYTIKVTPLEEGKSDQTFKIETSNLDQTMDKYTRDKEGTITALWEIVRR